MCEKRSRKIKKGSHLTLLREARRLQRMQRMPTPPTSDDSRSSPCPQQVVDKTAQNRILLELTWKTVALMHKNRQIQQKILALQKETSEFVATVMNNPENRRRYMEHLRLYGQPQQTPPQPNTVENSKLPIKIEPED